MHAKISCFTVYIGDLVEDWTMVRKELVEKIFQQGKSDKAMAIPDFTFIIYLSINMINKCLTSCPLGDLMEGAHRYTGATCNVFIY